jgi:hypothetical protein
MTSTSGYRIQGATGEWESAIGRYFASPRRA